MKKLAILFAGLFIMAISVQNVNAQSSASISDAEAGATIIAPLTLTNDLSLEFGKIVKSTTGGDVVITAEESPSRTPSGGLTFIGGDTWRPAKFTVTADDDQSFSITKDATITLDGPTGTGTDEMTITTSISGSTTGVSTSGGLYEFYIGGTMPVADDQIIGDYSGVYEVTVQYE
jgi:hypothetical protein